MPRDGFHKRGIMIADPYDHHIQLRRSIFDTGHLGTRSSGALHLVSQANLSEDG
jgi:hypothetical protein